MTIQIMNSKIWPLMESLVPVDASPKNDDNDDNDDFEIVVLCKNGEFINGGSIK